jgi:uncharacterized UBP type Zn finger protein
MKAGQEKTVAYQEKIETNMEVNQEKMKIAIKSGHEEMKVTVRASQEEMDAAIHSIPSELEETIINRVEDVMSYCDQHTGPPRGTHLEE